ncbi:FMN-binding protein [Collinsella sp. AGMB00827]|uniref:FMN-binding protein n=1 Tax=Collinsella ureilytica TaxID=2869515 RepID=A0ABS7MIU0_9ACTN|nr:FMN-binding protein [Collinsella urealyticum]
MDRHKNNPVYNVALMLIVVFALAGITTAVHTGLKSALQASDATLEDTQGGSARDLIFPQATFTQVDIPEIEGLESAWRTDAGDFVFDVKAEGYDGDVELLIGISAEGKVAGIQIVAEDETEGIGTEALTEEFFDSFTGMEAKGVLTIKKPSGSEIQVDGVSGATFTSSAVVDDINIAFEAFAQLGGE